MAASGLINVFRCAILAQLLGPARAQDLIRCLSAYRIIVVYYTNSQVIAWLSSQVKQKNLLSFYCVWHQLLHLLFLSLSVSVSNYLFFPFALLHFLFFFVPYLNIFLLLYFFFFLLKSLKNKKRLRLGIAVKYLLWRPLDILFVHLMCLVLVKSICLWYDNSYLPACTISKIHLLQSTWESRRHTWTTEHVWPPSTGHIRWKLWEKIKKNSRGHHAKNLTEVSRHRTFKKKIFFL